MILGGGVGWGEVGWGGVGSNGWRGWLGAGWGGACASSFWQLLDMNSFSDSIGYSYINVSLRVCAQIDSNTPRFSN